MNIDDCQRWREGCASLRPARETIRATSYDVAPIASAAVAKAFVERHHYAGTASPPAHRYGLYHHGDMVGVALFGPPASMNAHRKVFPKLVTTEAVTLGRLVLLDEVPGNGESFFVAQCFEKLAEVGVDAVESCADPQPRTREGGELVHRGHLGIVYQATNGQYIGRTNPATLRLFPDGTVLSNRSQGKVVRGEQGAGYAEDQLVRWGATPLEPGEDAEAWLDLWRGRLTRKMRHYGNHRYIWCLNRRRRRDVMRTHAALPYPKLNPKSLEVV